MSLNDFNIHVPAQKLWVRFLMKILINKISKNQKNKWHEILQNNLAAYPDDDIGREIAIFGNYEELEASIIEYLIDVGVIKINDDSIFMDVGANIGIYTCRLSSRFPVVFAFEPHPITADLLEFNLNSNGINNVKLHRYALSDEYKDIFLIDQSKQNRGASSISEGEQVKENQRCYSIKAKTGDGVLTSKELDKVGFMKIDVEGHEASVIKGCQDIILQSKPVIAFEANNLDKNIAIMDQLSRLNYDLFITAKPKKCNRLKKINEIKHAIFGKNYSFCQVDRHDISVNKYQMVFAIPSRK